MGFSDGMYHLGQLGISCGSDIHGSELSGAGIVRGTGSWGGVAGTKPGTCPGIFGAVGTFGAIGTGITDGSHPGPAGMG